MANYNRTLWLSSYEHNKIPKFPCPQCSDGRATLEPGSLFIKEPKFSSVHHNTDDWEPDWVVNRVSARFICDEPSCQEIIHAIGETTAAWSYGDEGEPDGFEEVIIFRSMFPAPPIISIPKKCNPKVQLAIMNSFQMFWPSLSSAANCLRISVEFLLDTLAVPREKPLANGSAYHMKLNDRIQHYEKTDPEHAPTMAALRMIGNLGSHSSEVTREALMDAYEIYEHCLIELIDKRSEYLKGLRDKLIAKKGDYTK